MDEVDAEDWDPGLLSVNQLVVVVYNPVDETVEVENPSGLPGPMVLGLLHIALDQWMDDDLEMDEDD